MTVGNSTHRGAEDDSDDSADVEPPSFNLLSLLL